MRVRREHEPEPRHASPATEPARRPPGLTAAGLLQLSRTAGNRAVCSVLPRRILARNPAKDAPEVAKKLYGSDSERDKDTALMLLRTAETMKFYEPVRELALSGKVLNPEGLVTVVNEFYAKAREKEPHVEGLVAELLHARNEARGGNYVQLGAWKPDPLQATMSKLIERHPDVASYLKELESEILPLGKGWGGDLVVWAPDKQGLAVTTVQHKVLETAAEKTLETELRIAAAQLAGQNLERPAPGRRVADLLISHPSNPLHDLSLDAQMLNRVYEILTTYSTAKRPLYDWVDEVVIATKQGRAHYLVGKEGKLTLGGIEPGNPVKELMDLTPKEQAPAMTEPTKAAQHSEEQKEYELALQLRKKGGAIVVVETTEEQAAKLWISSNRRPKEATAALEWDKVAAKHKDVLAKLAERNRKDRETAALEWAKQNPVAAKLIADTEWNIEARGVLAARRGKVMATEWTALYNLRNVRVNAIKGRFRDRRATTPPTTPDDTLVAQLMNEYEEFRPDESKRIAELEKTLIASTWFLTSDPKELTDAIERVVAAENEPEYTSTGASAASNQAKRARQKAAQERVTRERKFHAGLAKTLDGRIDEAVADTIFQQIGQVKELEGNRAVVAGFVNQLAGALEQAWKTAELMPKAIDVVLLKAATTALAKINAGVGYVGALGEINELNRQSQVVGASPTGAMISQWYALDKGVFGTWEEADTSARTTHDTSIAQEVDVSHVDEKGVLHAAEVAADVDVLELKLCTEGKRKQRESYVKLQATRQATVSYVLDSPEGWEKIFLIGTGKEMTTKYPPIVDWLVNHSMPLVVAGKTFQPADLESRVKKD